MDTYEIKKKRRKIVDLSKIAIKKNQGTYCVYSISCGCPVEI
ncbi:hypothetical protein RUMOBE_01459 [Blautia obeum ATCC 29174]|uniref:Uncharacterized protein n=1 Tax=Blautia obeum ATCC 29174 TaxID=411459 RepID=A5ZR32_9FIRM|nr:hypothetical protein RUMOBE_01459 [Blautia obeum ATCC 29174]